MINVAQIKQWQARGGALLSASVLFFSANMVSNIANYGTQVMLGRLLGPLNYGCYNALMAVLVLLSIPISALGFLITRQVAQYQVAGQTDSIVRLYQYGLFKLLLLGGFLVALIVLLMPLLRNYLHIDNALAIFLLGPIAMIALFQPYNLAFSQGLQDFRWVAMSGATAGPVRFIVSVTAAWVGWGVNGTMMATLLAGFFGWMLSSIPLRNFFRRVTDGVRVHNKTVKWGDVIPVFIAIVSFVLMTQSDVIMVKHLFSAEEAGFYASASLLGKAVLYVPGAVVVGLVPMVAGQESQKKAWGLLCKALWITAFLSGVGALLFWLMPGWILQTFFGEAYLPATLFLQYFGCSMLPMAFVLVFKVYFIAKGVAQFSYVLLLGAVSMILTITFYATVPMDVIVCMGVWGMIVATIGFMMERFNVLKSDLILKGAD